MCVKFLEGCGVGLDMIYVAPVVFQTRLTFLEWF